MRRLLEFEYNMRPQQPHMGHESSARRELSRRLHHCEWKLWTRFQLRNFSRTSAVKRTYSRKYEASLFCVHWRKIYFYGEFFLCPTRLSPTLIKRSLEPMQTLTLSLKQHQSADFSNFTNIASHKRWEFSFRFRIFFFFCYFLSRIVVGVFLVQCVGFGADIFPNVKKPMKKGKEKHEKLHFHEIFSRRRQRERRNMLSRGIFGRFSPVKADSRQVIKFSKLRQLSHMTHNNNTHLNFDWVDALLWQNIVQRKVQTAWKDSIGTTSCSVEGWEKQEKIYRLWKEIK